MSDEVLRIGQWAVGFKHSDGAVLVRFEWSNRPPLMLEMPAEQAGELAQAILANCANTPHRH